MGRHVVRQLSAFVISGALLLSAAGCGTAPPSLPPSLTPTSLPATSTSTPTMPPAPTLLPTLTNTPFVPKATFKIAVHVPLTGEPGDIGRDMYQASRLAVFQLSGPLELMGYAVELVSYDDKFDRNIAAGNARELVKVPEILCGVGHYDSRSTIQASEIYHQAGLAFISPSATNPVVTDRGYLEVNRVVGRNDMQGAAGAHFARERGFKAVYMIYTKSDPYSQKNADYFKREAAKLELTLVGELATDISSGFEGLVRRILEANTDLVYFPAFGSNQIGTFVKEARELGYTGAILGIDGIARQEVLNFAGPLAIGGGGLYYTTMGATLASLPDAAQFSQDFRIESGRKPLFFAPYAYDAAGICLKAIEDASRAKGGDIPTRAEVALAIRALVDYQGITGTYNFGSKGDPLTGVYQISQVTTLDPGKWEENPVVATYEIEPPGR